MSLVKRFLRDDKSEVGVDFLVLASPGIGYFEPNRQMWYAPTTRTVGHLLPDQILKVIGAAGVPLPGWERDLPDDWFKHPRRDVSPGRKRPDSVMRAFNKLRHPINSLLPSLTGVANAATARALRSRADELRNGGPKGTFSVFDRSDAKRAFGRDRLVAIELDVCQAALGEAMSQREQVAEATGMDLGVYAKRLEFMAEMAGEDRINKPIVHLMPHLVQCFEETFDSGASRRWEDGVNAQGDPISVPSGPFPLFGSALLREMGFRYTPKSMHQYLGQWRTLRKVKQEKG